MARRWFIVADRARPICSAFLVIAKAPFKVPLIVNFWDV